MPLLKRKPFTPDKPPTELKPTEEVFVCRHTNEVFTDYESFFKRTILCNSLVWSCKLSGKSNLTYHEALESEKEIIKQAEKLSAPLQGAALTLVHHIQRGRLANLCDEVFSYLKDRYQEGEDVVVQHLGNRKKGKVQKVIEPEEVPNGFDNQLDSPKTRKSSSSSIKDKKTEKSTGTPAKIRKSSVSDKESPVKSRKGSESSYKSPSKVRSVSEPTPDKSRKNSSKESITSPRVSQRQSKDISTPKSKKSQKNGLEKLKSPKSKTSSCTKADGDVILVEDDEEINGKSKENKGESLLKSPKGNGACFFPDPTTYKYAIKLYPDKKSKENKRTCKEVIIVEFNHISRKKGSFTREKLKNFLKISCVRSTQHSDGFYYVKVEFRKRFDLGEPLFEIPIQLSSPPKGKSRKRKKSVPEDGAESSSVKKKKLEGEEETEKAKKSKSKVDGKGKYKRSNVPKVKKLTPEEKLKIIEEERQKRRVTIEEDKEKRRIQREQDRLEQKNKREEERAQKKIERDQEREKLREQKRQEAVWLKEWSKPREDLELDDLKDLPQPLPVQVKISNELFGDAVMVLEFLRVFGTLFDMKDEFPTGLHFTMLEEALAEHDVEGVFYDLLQFLLGAILRTHMEEEEDEGLESADAQTPLELDDEDYHTAKVSASAAMAAVWPILHQGKPLHELIMDPFTCTELLRLHLLSSGARVGCGDPEYRWHSRGGFTYSDDAGVEFRHREPHVMKTLMTGSVYDLSAEEKLKILTALCGQLMTYATSREYIEDGFDKLKKTRREWLSDQWAEQRREKEEAAARYRKRQEERSKQKEELEKKKKDKENEKNQEDGKPVAMETNSDEAKPTEESKPAKEETKKERKKKKTGKDSEKERENESEAKSVTEETEKSVEDKEKQEDVSLSKEEEEQVALQKKIDRERREQEYLSVLRKAVSMSNVQPLGRDRIYRRYWLFKSLNGLFIEDDDPDLPTFLETIFEEENCEEEETQESNKEGQKDDDKTQNTDKTDQSENKPKQGSSEEKERVVQHSEKLGGLKSVLKRDFDKMVKDGVMTASFNQQNRAKRGDVIEKYGKREGITRWSFIAGVDDFECLVSSLNPRGQRERVLREALQLDFRHLRKGVEKCPFKEENIVPKKIPKSKSSKQQAVDKSRYENTEDFVEANLRDQILDLEDRLWQGGLGAIKVEDRMAWRTKIENGIYSHLEKTVETENKEAGVKTDVNDMKENDDNVETNGDVSMKEEKDVPLVNGVTDKSLEEAEETEIKEEKANIKTTRNSKMAVLTNGDAEESEVDTEPELVKVEESKAVFPADIKPSEQTGFKAIPAHLKLDFSSNRTSFSPPESRTGTPVISLAPTFEHINPAAKELALALLKVEQGIESKYLSPPLGEDEETKRQKQKDAAALALAEFNEMMKDAAEVKDRKKKAKLEQNEKETTDVKSAENEAAEETETKHEEDDDRSSNSSKAKDPPKQKTCLERWEESLMACTSLSQIFVHLNTLDGSVTWSKSVLNARCRLCRRKGDAEKMLLCDACDRGHHMYCLKPPIKQIPEGNWFCPDCRPKETRRSERRRRAPVADDEDDNEEQEDDDDESESEDESDEESDTEEESEQDDVSDADSEHVDICALCEQDGELLCCDVCPLAYHVDCAFPPLRRIPRGNWACQVCTGADDERPKKCRVKKSTIKAALRNAKEIEKLKTSKSTKPKKAKSNKRSLSPVTPKLRGRKESTDSGPKASKRQKVRDPSTSSSMSTPTTRSKRNIPATLRIKGRSSVDSSRSPSPVRKSATRRDPRVTGRLIKCGKLLDEVIGHVDAEFFTETISFSKFPNYNRNPIDLEIIKTNLKENVYDSVEDFISDVRKVFIDCADHFRPRAKEARAGVRLSAFFETRLSEMGLDSSERSVRSCRRN